MTVNPNRIVEREGVNACRALFEKHGHIVQEISGGADYGEDLLISLVKDRARTGDSLYVQVKSGTSYKNGDGYYIPMKESHSKFWKRSNLPVYGVVYDPDKQSLHWVNATELLRADSGKSTRIPVKASSVLSSDTIYSFMDGAVDYIAHTGDLHKAFSSMFHFDPGVLSNTDYLSYFENEFGERMLFQQRVNERQMTLYHLDRLIDGPIVFEREDIQMLSSDESGSREARYSVANTILDREEFAWLAVCATASKYLVTPVRS